MCVSGHVCVSGLSILPLFLRFVSYYILELYLLRFRFSFHLIEMISFLPSSFYHICLSLYIHVSMGLCCSLCWCQSSIILIELMYTVFVLFDWTRALSPVCFFYPFYPLDATNAPKCPLNNNVSIFQKTCCQTLKYFDNIFTTSGKNIVEVFESLTTSFWTMETPLFSRHLRTFDALSHLILFLQ
jgi:hypothetical protein